MIIPTMYDLDRVPTPDPTVADRYEMELARREQALDDMRQDERDENRFLLAIVGIVAAGGGAALMLAAVSLFGLFFVLSNPLSVAPQPQPAPIEAVPPTATAVAAATAVPGPTLGLTQEGLEGEPTPSPTAPSTPAPTVPPTVPPTVQANLPPADAAPTAQVALPQVGAPDSPLAVPPMAFEPTYSFASNGLGLSRSDWETLYGSPSAETPDSVRYGTEGALIRDVVYLDDRVISVNLQSAQPLTIDQAMANGIAALPADAQQINTYTPVDRPQATVTVYRSQSLADRLGLDPKFWPTADPGTMVLTYDLEPGGIRRILVRTGN